MYTVEKISYPDPKPVGYCAVCGEPIYWGDKCYTIPEGDMVHATGVYRNYREIWERKPLLLSCLATYIIDNFSQEELAEAVGLEAKRWE